MSSKIIETTNVTTTGHDEQVLSNFIDRERLATLKRTLLAYRKSYEEKIRLVGTDQNGFHTADGDDFSFNANGTKEGSLFSKYDKDVFNQRVLPIISYSSEV
ncbi:hypothetical protein ACHWQZ_G000096 [Mnemiopsis leidyi]